MEWQVWLADGTTRDSARHRWDDVPDSILVVRWWSPQRNGVLWGDSAYGHPATLRGSADVADDVFQRALAAAQATTVPPSGRA